MSALLVAALVASPASPYRVDYTTDSALTGALFAGGALFALIDVDANKKWDKELLSIDESVKQNFSPRAAGYADATVLATSMLPLLARAGSGLDEDLGKSSLIYVEALGGSFFLNSAAKYLVQRPRPYVYNDKAQAYAAEQGSDSRLSFYSGHAAMSFTAAVAGSFLFAQSSSDTGARATLWGVELGLATATANFRVRAGKHFYSDVLVGAVAGSAIGFAVPYLHQKLHQPHYAPSRDEYLAMGGGVLAGALFSQLAPLGEDGELAMGIETMPMVVEGGGGMMVQGVF